MKLSLQTCALACCYSLIVALSLNSCSIFKQQSTLEREAAAAKASSEEAKAAAAAAAHINPLRLDATDIAAETLNVNSSAELEKIDNGADGEIFFTDPDNPDAAIEGIDEAFLNRALGHGWLTNYQKGLRTARLEGIPTIIWFHDSVLSKESKTIARDLLETEEFNNWCHERVLRIKLDAGAGLDDSSGKKARYSRDYVNNLQHRYKLKGKPAIAIVSANGEIVGRIHGYEGYTSGLELEIRKGVEAAERVYKEHRVRLKSQDYRDWHSLDGKYSAFAKVTRYDEKKDIIYLKQDTGRQMKLSVLRLSAEDVDYIDRKHRKPKNSN